MRGVVSAPPLARSRNGYGLVKYDRKNSDRPLTTSSLMSEWGCAQTCSEVRLRFLMSECIRDLDGDVHYQQQGR